MAGFMYGGGGGGGISSVSGTAGQITAATVGGAVTLSMPAAVSITGIQEAGGFKTNGDEVLVGQGVTAAYEKERTFTSRRHIPINSATAGSWVDIISWRPYMEGTTNDPTALQANVMFEICVYGHIGSAGNGSRRMCGVVFYNATGATSADGFINDTSGTTIDFRVNRVGWVTTLQWKVTAPGTGLTGAAAVNMHFARGASTDGNSIIWNIT